MIQRFEVERNAYNNSEREFAVKRKNEQEDADRLCVDMFKNVVEILQTEGQKKKLKNWPLYAFIMNNLSFWGGDYRLTDEFKIRWKTQKLVDIGNDESKVVTLIGHGGETPAQIKRIFIHIEDFPYYLEVAKASGYGRIWREAIKNEPFNANIPRATIVDAKFYGNILARFRQAPASSPR